MRRPGTHENQSSPTPSSRSRPCSHAPHASSPTALPERRARAAPCRDHGCVRRRAAAVRHERVCLREARHRPFAEEVDERLAEAEHGHAGKYRGDVRPCPPRLRAGRRPLAAAVACTAFALWNPPLRDLAAHTFRADFFDRARLRDLEQQLVRRPLPALLQRAVPAARRAAVADLGGRRGGRHERVAVRSHRPRALGRRGRMGGTVVRRSWAPSRCWRTDGSCSRSAWRSASARCARLQPERRTAAVLLGVGAALASPVAAAFLALVCAVGALYSPRRDALLLTVGAALIPLSVLGLLFPESGEFPFWFSAWWPLALFCVLALVATRGDAANRDVRAVLGRVPGAGDALRAAAQPAGRQHDAARLAVRRARAAGRAAGAAARCASRRSPLRRWPSGSPGR